MYVVIGNQTYTDISNLNFSPRISLMANNAPVNFFTVDIKTTNSIPSHGKAQLYNDYDVIFADFYISDVQRKHDNIVSIKAEDIMSQLDEVVLEAAMIDQPMTFHDSLEWLQLLVFLAASERISFSIGLFQDTYLSIKGFFPQQTARERLLMLAFAAGACVNTCFATQDITIKKFDPSDDPTYITMDKVYWMPQKNNTSKITDISINAYSFAQTTAELIKPTDEYVVSYPGNVYWIYTETAHTRNINQSDAVRDVSIGTNYLVHSGNVNSILSNLAAYYQNAPGEITLEIACVTTPIKIGDYISFYTGVGNEVIAGYVEEEDFTFGNTTKVKVKIHGIKFLTGCTLTIRHMSGLDVLKTDELIYPYGETYHITPDVLELNGNSHEREIYCPSISSITNTIIADSTVDVPYIKSLVFDHGRLDIYNVDGATDFSGVIEIEGH